MNRTTMKNTIGLFALVALSACGAPHAYEQRADGVEQCPYPQTLTCDRFAGEDYNCSCERGDKLQEIVDSY